MAEKKGVHCLPNAGIITALGLGIALVAALMCLLAIPDTYAQTQPTIVSIFPDTFVVDSQDVFTITGSSFEDTPTVTVDFQALVDVGFVSTTTLTATVPADLAAGVYTVTVTNPGGLSDSLADGLTIQNPTPTLLGFNPASGFYGQVTMLTITGTHFVSIPVVSLDETPCPVVQFVSSTTLTATVLSGLPPGVYDLTVTNPGPNDPHDTLPDVFTLRSPTPTVTAIKPIESPNNLDTQVVITGASFVPTPTVGLGEIQLQDVAWVSSTRLTALVPWGMDAGVYDLVVANPGPDTPSATLTSAFTVTQAIGVWTSGGPYGGSVYDIAVSPATSQTAFAVVRETGLFRTQDGGDTWNQLLHDRSGQGIAYGLSPTNTLYYWGESGLQYSIDDGDLWSVLVSDKQVNDLAFDPHDYTRLWIATNQGIYLSEDSGTHWAARNNGLPTDLFPHTIPQLLALDPSTSSIVYAALRDGRVFRTIDSGLTWEERSSGLSLSASDHGPHVLAVNPFSPGVLLYSYSLAPTPIYRSVDGGENWSPVDIGPEEHEQVTDLAFSLHVSGTVYVSRMGETLAAISEDAGATWTPFGTRTGDWMLSLGLDPSSGLPAYLGGGASGTWRSDDAGQTWSLSTEGITGLLIEDIAAAPSRPETVYVAAEHAGGLGSDYAGTSWRELDLAFPAAFAVAVAPRQSDIAYIGTARGVYSSLDGGITWERTEMPAAYPTFINNLAVSPISSAVVFAGGRNDEVFQFGQNAGVVFRSTDYGATWTELNIGHPISIVSSIAFDPVDDQIVYLATGKRGAPTESGPGLGVFRSLDQGDTWEPIANGMGQVPALGITVHPDEPQTIYATVWLAGESKVFSSTNRGDLWMSIDFPGNWAYGGADIVIDPLSPNVLYVASQDGLFRSSDSGTSWSQAAGTLGQVPIYSLSIASANERTILYAGTTGGLPSSGMDSAFTLSTDDEFVAAGVYQQTISHRPLDNHIYLPLMLR